MENIFSVIGSIASILGVPLAIYLYLKSKESKFDKIKREIVKVLSYQIGEERELSAFEIQSVINSKLRESRIKINAIDVNDVIEDLVAETMASPLLDSGRKQTILRNLRGIHVEEDLTEMIGDFTQTTEVKNITETDIKKLQKELEKELENLNATTIALESKTGEINKQIGLRSSELYAILATLIGFIAMLITAFDLIDFSEFFDEFNIKKKEVD